MEPIQIDNWTITAQKDNKLVPWIANQLLDIDNPEMGGYNVYILGESIFVDGYGNHEDQPFIEVPLTVIKKLLELK